MDKYDDLVKALQYCAKGGYECEECKYECDGIDDCINEIELEAADAIESLAAQLAEAKAERSAAVEDISTVAFRQRVMPCAVCKHQDRPVLVNGQIDKTSPCVGCSELSNHFEWRGLQPKEVTGNE